MSQLLIFGDHRPEKATLAYGARVIWPALLLAALLALSSCMRSAPAPPPPTTREFLKVEHLKHEDIWTAMVRAMTKSLNVKHIDPKEGVIKGRLTEWGYTEYVQVSIKPPQPGAASYRVDVISTRARSVVMRDWADTMLEDIKGNIQRIPGQKEGDVKLVSEPLP